MNRLMLSNLVMAASFLVGCAPPGLPAGIRFAADKYQSRDASTLCVTHHPQYRFDVRLQSDLQDAVQLTDLDAIKREGARILTAAHTLAVKTVGEEIDRMPPAGIAFLIRHYDQEPNPNDTDAKRENLKHKFAELSRTTVQKELAQLQASADVRVARRLLTNIEKGIEDPVGDRGRVGRALIAAPFFLPAAIGAEIADSMATQRNLDTSFNQVFIYHPTFTEGVRTAGQLENATDDRLARWYAPVFVQQADPDAPYPPSEDQFGCVSLTGSPENVTVKINIQQPTVYWTTQEAKIESTDAKPAFLAHRTSQPPTSDLGAKKRKQFVYVAWYPSRPALQSGDSEAGLIDGVVIRVTLDRLNRPAVYEFVRTCGCYHMLYVAEFLEAAARAHFGSPLTDKKYAIQDTGSKRELFIPALVPDDGSHPTRPVVFVSAGHHLLMGVQAGGVWHGDAKVNSDREYELVNYDVLTRLPLGAGIASMFGSDGLVHNAGRAEGWLLAPTGMRSAGQPRQLGTMKIRMDAYDYDDPYLLDRQLRFPPSF